MDLNSNTMVPPEYLAQSPRVSQGGQSPYYVSAFLLHKSYKCLCICLTVWHHQGSLVAHTVKNLPVTEETGFDPWLGRIPWRRDWFPSPVFYCLGNPMDKGLRRARVHGARKIRTY